MRLIKNQSERLTVDAGRQDLDEGVARLGLVRVLASALRKKAPSQQVDPSGEPQRSGTDLVHGHHAAVLSSPGLASLLPVDIDVDTVGESLVDERDSLVAADDVEVLRLLRKRAYQPGSIC